MSEYEFLPNESLEAWIIRQVDRETRGWSDETWKILGITQDLIDLKQLRLSTQTANKEVKPSE